MSPERLARGTGFRRRGTAPEKEDFPCWPADLPQAGNCGKMPVVSTGKTEGGRERPTARAVVSGGCCAFDAGICQDGIDLSETRLSYV